MEMWTLSRVLAYFACKTPALGSKADVWQAKYLCAKVYLLCNNIILMITSIFDCNWDGPTECKCGYIYWNDSILVMTYNLHVLGQLFICRIKTEELELETVCNDQVNRFLYIFGLFVLQEGLGRSRFSSSPWSQLSLSPGGHLLLWGEADLAFLSRGRGIDVLLSDPLCFSLKLCF